VLDDLVGKAGLSVVSRCRICCFHLLYMVAVCLASVIQMLCVW
jgi:hypothetical protein